jgi:predicted hotdog family 3-hydroxylacyl-ACP dehydratase
VGSVVGASLLIGDAQPVGAVGTELVAADVVFVVGGDVADRVRPAASGLFKRADGSVPAWVGIEYMAQCAAAHGGLLGHARGEAPRPALFVGSRRLVFRCECFTPDQAIVATARLAAGRSDTLAFDCTVEDPAGGAPLVEGRLHVLLLRELPPAGASA